MPESAQFDALVREFFAVWLRYHPEVALETGVADAAVALPPPSDDDHAALAGWLETLVVGLEELDYGALDPARQLDLELLFGLARSEHRELLEHDWHHRDPLAYLPLDLIHRVTLAGGEALRETLVGLLRTLPAHLRLALAQLQPMAPLVPPLLVQAACAAARDGRDYLRALARSSWLRKQCSGCGEIEQLAESAGAALAHYADALEREVAPDAAAQPGCGAQRLALLLRRRHWLEPSLDCCEALLDHLAAQCDAELADLPATASEPSSGAAPPAGDPLLLAERMRVACRETAQRLATLGLRLPQSPLRVVAGPVAPATLPCRVCYLPDLGRGEGSLWIAAQAGTPAPMPAAAEARLHCLRLGWGGTHRLAFGGGMATRSLPRRSACAQSLSIGSALYLESRLCVGVDDAQDCRAALRQRRRDIQCAQVDLALHCGRLAPEQALARLRGLGLGAGPALRRLAVIVQRPGDALAGVLGWRLIEAALARSPDTKAAPPAPERLDRLMALGPIPLPLAMRHGLGADAWQRAWDAAGIASHHGQCSDSA